MLTSELQLAPGVSRVLCLLGLQIESVVSFLDEALLAHELADEPADKSGDHEGADDEADPVQSRAGRSGGEVNAESGVLFAHGGRPAGDEADLAAEAGAGKDAAKPLVLNFTDTSKMTWPVRGNVLLDYSMDQTIYFPTLDQYKCNPGLVIQSDVSTPVAAPANAKVVAVGSNEEIGNYVTLDLGNDYTAICGQLKEVCAVEGEYLEAGQTLGYVSEPTKYYSVEGVNVFFELQHEGKTVDPLDYME